jgi:hypothetical protein
MTAAAFSSAYFSNSNLFASASSNLVLKGSQLIFQFGFFGFINQGLSILDTWVITEPLVPWFAGQSSPSASSDIHGGLSGFSIAFESL